MIKRLFMFQMLKQEVDMKNKRKQEGIVLKNGTVVKIYHLTDPEFARLCGVELTNNEFTEVKVDDNGQVINLKNGGKKNED